MMDDHAEAQLALDLLRAKAKFDGGWSGMDPEVWIMFQYAWRLGYRQAELSAREAKAVAKS